MDWDKLRVFHAVAEYSALIPLLSSGINAEYSKTTVTADFKKAESIKLMNEAGEKIHQSIKDGKALEEVGKENNLAVTKLGPFDSVGGAIPGLANKANREDVRTQALGLDVGAISELITSSTDSSDLASEEAAFVVKLTGKNAVSKDRVRCRVCRVPQERALGGRIPIVQRLAA